MHTPVLGNHPTELLQAFLKAEYAVAVNDREYVVRIGRTHPALDTAVGCCDWSIITPVNPGARVLDEDDNAARCSQLAASIRAAGLSHFPACNRDPEESWPDEPGFLVLEADRQRLDRLAYRFEQAGIVTGRPGRVAELRLYGDGWPDRLPQSVTRAD